MKCLVCDHDMAPEEDWLYACSSCGFEQSLLAAGSGRGVEGLERLRKQNFQYMIERLEKIAPFGNMRCLEVGPAEGWFLEAMRARNVEVMAIEASDQALQLQAKGYNVIHGFFPEALKTDQKFDLIVFNDVFEHLPDPVSALKTCERLLNDQGILLLNLPNRNGFFYRLSKTLRKFGLAKPFERLWQKDLPSPHLTYFSDTNLRRFVEAHSHLSFAEKFYLPSIIKEGLEQRIQNTYDNIFGKLIFYGLAIAIPLLKFLPQDIMVFIFRKK